MRKIAFVVLAVVFVAAGVHLATRPKREAAWTTDSPQALAEFQQALDAQTKFYRTDAFHHLQRALELDPDFVAAKLEIQYFPDLLGEKEAARLAEELRAADLSRLTPRERFIVSFRTAQRSGDRAKAEKILAGYLAEHPDDPWALRYKVAKVWEERSWEEAERLYRQLIEIDPNWVLAHNHLGYIAMGRGRFAEAEEAFRTYRFIAPDQANPHDSLGELLMLVGRYEEAQAELEEALRIRPDFCASYAHLADLFALQGKPEQIAEVARRAEPHCARDSVANLRCRAEGWSAAARGDFEALWTLWEDGLCSGLSDVNVLAHRAGVATGRVEEAQAIEQDLRDRIDYLREEGRPVKIFDAMLLHLEGARLEEQGNLAGAAERFAAVDEKLPHWGHDGEALFKLYNLAALARTLHAAGRGQEARAAQEKLAAVNPRFLQQALNGEAGIPTAREPRRRAVAAAAGSAQPTGAAAAEAAGGASGDAPPSPLP